MSGASAQSTGRSGHRVAWTLTICAVIVVLLGLALWAADGLARGIAQDSVADAVESKLPDDVEADVNVSIDGGLFLPQLIAGDFTEVTLTAKDATAAGIPFDITVVAKGVPLDENGTIDTATARVSGGEDAANALLALGGADPQLSLGDGTLSYDQTTTFLGMNIGYTVEAEPEAHGETVTLSPRDVHLTSDFGSLDLTPLIQRILDDKPVEICVASSLPDGTSVDDVTVTPEHITFELSAADIPRNGPDLSSRGSCES